MMTVIDGGITAVPGFKAQGVMAGIKYREILDLALVVADEPCPAAAVYTTNLMKAAPLKVTQEHLAGGMAQAIVVNSGCANACTGNKGEEDAREMADITAQALGIAPESVIVASTGVIGSFLPMDRIEQGIHDAAGSLSEQGGHNAALAILTTDTRTKEYAVEIKVAGSPVRIGAMAKGSGMIHPNMATMLGFITTDIKIAPAVLDHALRAAVNETFNMISVDGDTSTNDMVCILASGKADNQVVDNIGSDAYRDFLAGLTAVCRELAKMIAADGEGASHLLEVIVDNAPTKEDARLAARAIASSNLVKAAVFGQDANWGRIVCAVGYSGAEFHPECVDVYLGSQMVARDSMAIPFDEDLARQQLEEQHVTVRVDLKSGEYQAAAWGCDLSFDYVRINASYRT